MRTLIAIVMLVGILEPAAIAQTPNADSTDLKILIPIHQQNKYWRSDLTDAFKNEADRLDNHHQSDQEFKIGIAEIAALWGLKRLGVLQDFELNETALVLQFQKQNTLDILKALPGYYGLHVAKLPQNRTPLVVLVHGLEGSPSGFVSIQSELERTAIRTATFCYPNDQSIEKSAIYLASESKKLLSSSPDLEIAFICHSMDGLVVCRGIEIEECLGKSVTKVITLGTPFRGSHVATMQQMVEIANFFQQSLSQRLLPSIESDGLGEGAIELLPESDFLQRVARHKPQKSEIWFCIAGDRGPVKRIDSAKLQAQLDGIVANASVSARTKSHLNSFFHSQELNDGMGDGAVTVASAVAPWAFESRVFREDHLSLLQTRDSKGKKTECFSWCLEVLSHSRKSD